MNAHSLSLLIISAFPIRTKLRKIAAPESDSEILC